MIPTAEEREVCCLLESCVRRGYPTFGTLTQDQTSVRVVTLDDENNVTHNTWCQTENLFTMILTSRPTWFLENFATLLNKIAKVLQLQHGFAVLPWIDMREEVYDRGLTTVCQIPMEIVDKNGVMLIGRMTSTGARLD